MKMSADEKDAALAKLHVSSQAGTPTGCATPCNARDRAKGISDDMGVGDVLIACSRDKDDPYLRELSAFAMNFWRGDAAANARMEEALLALTHDDGAGEDKLSELSEDQEESPTADVLSALTGGGGGTDGGFQHSRVCRFALTPPWRLARMGSKEATT